MPDMIYRRLGSSGLNVSVVGIGCNNFGRQMDQDGVNAVVSTALEVGVTLFDTAASYGESEERLGKALGSRRGEAVIATKFPSPFEASKHATGSRHHIVRACEGSLRRLGTDYIDLYQMHRPDPMTPIDETLSVLDDLVRSGKVRYIGNSNFASWQIADADWTSRTNGWARMVSAQNYYSLLKRDVERDVIPACERFGLGMLPFFPLASGVLTGKYKRGREAPEGSRLGAGGPFAAVSGHFLNDQNFDQVEALKKVARDEGVSLVQIAIGRLAAQPAVASVIAGATNPEQVRANAEAGTWEPSAEIRAAIDAAAPPPHSIL
jgi:aryl-alcohol dehydrogenase-like predicted oxidoreductase